MYKKGCRPRQASMAFLSTYLNINDVEIKLNELNISSQVERVVSVSGIAAFCYFVTHGMGEIVEDHEDASADIPRCTDCTMKQNRIAELSMHMLRMSPVIQLHGSVKNTVSLLFFPICLLNFYAW